MECNVDRCYLFLNAPPQLSPSEIMHLIRGGTGFSLRSEFPSLSLAKQLWTRNFFVSTAGSVSSETIKNYVNEQKKR